MTDGPATPVAKPPRQPSRLRKWVWRLGLTAVVAVAVTVGRNLVVRLYDGRSAADELAAARAELDRDAPGWRLDDYLGDAEAKYPPPDRNSAEVVARVSGLLPADWAARAETVRWGRDFLGDAPPTPGTARELLAGCEPACEAADTLTAFPAGGVRLTIAPDVIGTRLVHVDHTRRVFALLAARVDEQTAAGRPDDAVRSAHALLNAARSMGEDPFLICLLARRSGGVTAARAAMRVLANAEPRAGLAELQQAFMEEGAAPLFEPTVRGERATIDRLFENMAAGTVGPPSGDPVAEWLIRPKWQRPHATALRLWHRAAAAAALPYHEQAQLFAAITAEATALPQEREPGNVLLSLMLPAFQKVSAGDARCRALELTAAVCLACERHRQHFGRWPESLTDLPKNLLPEIPADPFDGRPLRFRRLADGVAVYSIGPNGSDDGGDVAFAGDDPGPDFGFRLRDVPRRALPPLETAPEPREVNP